MKVDKLKSQMEENEKEVRRKSEHINKLADELDTKTKQTNSLLHENKQL